jgi:PAS domain S-box-containing protein
MFDTNQLLMKSTEQQASRQLDSIKGVFENNRDVSYQLFDNLPIGICITDQNGKFTDVNMAYTELYGFTKDELIGESFLKIVPEQSQDELSDLHSKFMGRKYELSGRWKVHDKAGEKFEILSNAAYLDSEEHYPEPRKMTFVVKVNELEETISKLKDSIALLENKLDAQSAAASISEHQMRNRLGSIVTIANMLQKTELTETQNRWIQLIRNAGQDTIEMLNTTKDFAAMERGTFEPQITEFDILDLFSIINSETEQLQQMTESEVVILVNGNSLDYDDEIIVDADKTYIKHLFKNLITNALEAAPANSKIIVDTKTSNNDFLEISVHNPGVIPQKIRGSFFEKYSTSGKKQGTGLGTYIAKMIVNLHEGNISFVTHEEEGTTLFVNIPRSLSKEG